MQTIAIYLGIVEHVKDSVANVVLRDALNGNKFKVCMQAAVLQGHGIKERFKVEVLDDEKNSLRFSAMSNRQMTKGDWQYLKAHVENSLCFERNPS